MMHIPVNFKLRERERAPAVMRFQQRMRHGQGEDLLGEERILYISQYNAH